MLQLITKVFCYCTVATAPTFDYLQPNSSESVQSRNVYKILMSHLSFLIRQRATRGPHSQTVDFQQVRPSVQSVHRIYGPPSTFYSCVTSYVVPRLEFLRAPSIRILLFPLPSQNTNLTSES
jgi:hypothetical protein